MTTVAVIVDVSASPWYLAHRHPKFALLVVEILYENRIESSPFPRCRNFPLPENASVYALWNLRSTQSEGCRVTLNPKLVDALVNELVEAWVRRTSARVFFARYAVVSIWAHPCAIVVQGPPSSGNVIPACPTSSREKFTLQDGFTQLPSAKQLIRQHPKFCHQFSAFSRRLSKATRFFVLTVPCSPSVSNRY
mgnify:CR=1 FL=1